jgi:hypothetical protein
MKKIFFLYLAITFSTVYAGGFMFPNVEYSYARLYLMNTNEDSEKTRPDHYIYADVVYAASKIGNGWEFSEQHNAQLNSVFRLGVDAMVTGLSSCYIPRHGIIYFDHVGRPVASLSICFECQRIQFWSTQKLPEFSTKYSEKNIPKIEKQFADLEGVLVKNGVPVYKNAIEYKMHIQKADSLYSNKGEIIFDYTKSNAFEDKLFTTEQIKTWIMNSNFRFKEGTETHFSKREGDTTSWSYPTLYSTDGTHIIFSNLSHENPTMTEASILNSNIKLPNGVSVGMSLDQIQATFQVWDGMAYPASIIVNYADANIRYVFENRTLKRIELVII